MKLSNYYKIFKLIGTGKFRFLLFSLAKSMGLRYLVLRFDPNWICNLKCEMCYFSKDDERSRPIRPMTIKQFDEIADKLFRKTRILFFGCGAEPLLSKDFVAYANTVGLYHIPYVSLVTNGQLLTEDASRALINNKFDEIIVSVDGATTATYESIRIGGSFHKLISNLTTMRDLKKNLRSQLPFVRFNFTAMKRNIHELGALIDLAGRLNVCTIRVRLMTNWGGAIDFASEALSREEYLEVIGNLKDRALANNVEMIYEGCYGSDASKDCGSDSYHPYECIFPWTSLFVRGNGDTRCCMWYPYGQANIFNMSLAEYEQSEELRAIKYNLSRHPEKSCLNKCNRNFGGV